jgi:hypothetical protein
MKRHLTLALLATFALSTLSACTGKQDEAAAPAPRQARRS